jgi:hypothetical protein
MSLPAHVAVEVDFNVEIDAKGEIVLFGEAAPTVENVIVATQTLPVTALYEADVSGDKFGLIEIWEPSAAQGNIRCQLANYGGADGPDLSGVYQTAAARLADGFERLLCDEFDCSGVAPYIESKYAGIEEYQTQRDFGRVMLGVYAHYLFGHVDATAAITNDKAFVESMLSCSAGGDAEDLNDASGAEVRYNSWTAPTGDVQTWDFAADNTAPGMDAKLAVRLVEAIVKKGLGSQETRDITSYTLLTSDISGGAAPSGSIAQIVRQVIGQDSSRANNVDGSARTLDKHLLLRFYAGDVIYVNIKVKKPYITVSGAAGYTGTANAPAMTDGAANLVTEVSGGYTLKITLADPVA